MGYNGAAVARFFFQNKVNSRRPLNPVAQHQATHRVGRVERLGDADVGELVSLKDFEQLGEVQERAAQPIDLLDHDTRDLSSLDVSDWSPRRRTLDVPSHETDVITVGQALPALPDLTLDARFARFALGVERVEILLNSILNRLAGVDRAGHSFGGSDRVVTVISGPWAPPRTEHASQSFLFFSPS